MLRRPEHGPVRRLDGALQFWSARVAVTDFSRKAAQNTIHGGLAGDLACGAPSYAVAKDEEAAVEIEAKGVFIGVAGSAHITLRSCPDAYIHRTFAPRLRLLCATVIAEAQLHRVG